jgi:hypothetical protein
MTSSRFHIRSVVVMRVWNIAILVFSLRVAQSNFPMTAQAGVTPENSQRKPNSSKVNPQIKVHKSPVITLDSNAIEECYSRVSDVYRWAKYLIFFGFLGMIWAVTGVVTFLCTIRPAFKLVSVVLSAFMTIFWAVICLTAPDIAFRAFFATYKSVICDSQ